MKNINRYRTPLEKMRAFFKWAHTHCPFCEFSFRGSCANRGICFNAWLHSSEDQKTKGGAK